MYADYQDQPNQTLVHILGSFLHQLITTAPGEPIQNEVVQKLNDIRHRGGKLGTEDTLALLQLRLLQLQRAFICIDAVDELEPLVRQQLFNILKDLGVENTRLFLTGRGHIESEVQKYFQVEERYSVIISARQHDIQQFVQQQIKENHNLNPEAMDDVLAKDIENAIIAKSQGMYGTEFIYYNT